MCGTISPNRRTVAPFVVTPRDSARSVRVYGLSMEDASPPRSYHFGPWWWGTKCDECDEAIAQGDRGVFMWNLDNSSGEGEKRPVHLECARGPSAT
jgi:hypothetical protein